MASQHSAKDGGMHEVGQNHEHSGSEYEPGPVQAGSEDSYDIQWLENNKYDDSNKDYYVKYVEDESFRNFVKSLLHMVTGANDGPVKRENILNLTGGDRHSKDENNTVVERKSLPESETKCFTQRKEQNKSSKKHWKDEWY